MEVAEGSTGNAVHIADENIENVKRLLSLCWNVLVLFFSMTNKNRRIMYY